MVKQIVFILSIVILATSCQVSREITSKENYVLKQRMKFVKKDNKRLKKWTKMHFKDNKRRPMCFAY